MGLFSKSRFLKGGSVTKQYNCMSCENIGYVGYFPTDNVGS